MRTFSSSPHPGHIVGDQHRDVLIDDGVLPAASHLTGPGAFDVLETTVNMAGGRLTSARPCHVQYRPGSDLVVRYDARVAWHGQAPTVETLLAATTRHGALPGTVPLTATTGIGPGTSPGEMTVGVWRWPFDPRLVGLGDAVTPTTASRLLGVHPHQVRLEVVAYRPTERAVVRATIDDGTVRYMKVVAPSTVDALVERHERLLASGVPVPALIAADHEAGIVVMEELAGDTLRLRLKSGTGPWPAPREFRRLTDALAATDLASASAVRSRVSNALGHAAMLAEILPDERERLDAVSDELRAARERSRQRSGVVIHGDLYEAQLIVDGPRIVGLLDIDDVGPGDPIDDQATVLGHLRYRAAITKGYGTKGYGTKGLGDRINAYADRLRRDFARHLTRHLDGDATELDIVTGAVLVGLSTGPFRIQQRRWPDEVRRHLDAAEALITAKPARRTARVLA